MSGTKTRGSELLQHRWTEKDLQHLLDIDHPGAKLVEFFPKGIPAPDGGWGTWQVNRDALAELIKKLLSADRIPGIHVFPKGIPFPDVFDVVFEAGSIRTH